VIGALVKVSRALDYGNPRWWQFPVLMPFIFYRPQQQDNSDVINFLLSTEIIPLCLRIMESGSELSKTVAIFIVQKILLDDLGLAYICQTYERFYAVGTVLSSMVNNLVDSQAIRLLKHVVRCYLRLSDNAR
jgi:CCR4-NOT transcription complex subunit 9